MEKILEGKKIAVIVEHKFIPEEMWAYQNGFGLYGAKVDFISRLYYGDWRPGNPNWQQQVFCSDVDPSDQQPWQSPERLAVDDNNDVSNINVDDYAAVIMSANYVSVRLRWSEKTDITCARDLVQSSPTASLFAEAMKRPNVIKGALCHGLWILAPYPDLLKDRKVTCHTVVMADILNCGAEVVLADTANGGKEPAKVVVDEDLVTGFSKHEVLPFIEAIADAIVRLRVCQ
jgi:protease I